MVYITIEDEKIPVSNFAFLYDITQNEELFKRFYDAEKNLKVDYMDFAHKIRVAFEAFALEEEVKKEKTARGIQRISNRYYQGKNSFRN